jgi:hypothetical protein
MEARRVISYIDGTKQGFPEKVFRNFDEFKEAFRQAFQQGGRGSNARLWDAIGGQEDLLLKLYANTTIQEKVTRHSKDGRVDELMARYRIPRHKANQLFEQIRIHEIQLIQEGMLPVAERQEHIISPTISPVTPPRGVRISQRANSGTLYTRTRPLPFTRPQERFLANNGGVPVRKLAAQFNVLFGQAGIPPRTQSSISNKRYRLSKQR